MHFELSASLWLLCAITGLAQAASDLPLVDLGYTLHQASLNTTGRYYNFSNIRYAEPPVGNLRWALPVPPQGASRTIDNGSVARICPQAYPSLSFVNEAYNSDYSKTGKSSVDDFSEETGGFDYPRNQADDPRSTEDCLFLDVMVPEAIFEKYANKGFSRNNGAAVMVWIYGGGYTAGTKYDDPPAGLIARSQSNDKEGIIFVALNYRLGALGWMSGPSFAKTGTPNLGLYDQRLALQWVQDNIHLFGGDPNRVTVFGESAGGGSIMYQITAYGGKRGKAPFQQAIMQSPGYDILTGNQIQDQAFEEFLSLLNVSSLEEARQVDTAIVQNVSSYQISNSLNGTFTYGPVADGNFVPDQPGLLLLHGQFDPDVKILIGHNGDEGLAFPFLPNETMFEDFISYYFPVAPQSVQNHITQVLYPPTLNPNGTVLEDYSVNGSKSINVTGYTNALGRQTFFTSDAVINCNTNNINRAFNGSTWAYFFTAPPALHGQELYYVFYNEQPTDVFYRPINATLAHMMQDYWTNFAQFGDPNGEGLPYFAKWGDNATVLNMSHAGVTPAYDLSDNERCKWWQLSYYT